MSKTNFVDGDPSQGILGTVVPADYLNALNNHYHTGLDQDGHGALSYAADSGTANAYVVTLNPALTQYVAGMPIYFKAANANTGASTININGLGVKSIKKNVSDVLIAGDIPAGGLIVLIYDGTDFQLRSVSATNTDKLLADGTYRTASVTPAANTVPVRDANRNISNVDGTNGILRYGTNSVDLGTVVAGSIYAVFYSVEPLVSAAGTIATAQIVCSGTATAKVNGNSGGLGNYRPGNSFTASSTGGLQGKISVCTIIEVITGGTLQLSLAKMSAGGSTTWNYELMTVIALKIMP